MTPWPMVPTRMLPFAAMVHLLRSSGRCLFGAPPSPVVGTIPPFVPWGESGLQYGRIPSKTGREATMRAKTERGTADRKPANPGRRAFVRGAAGIAGILAAGRAPGAWAAREISLLTA